MEQALLHAAALPSAHYPFSSAMEISLLPWRLLSEALLNDFSQFEHLRRHALNCSLINDANDPATLCNGAVLFWRWYCRCRLAHQ